MFPLTCLRARLEYVDEVPYAVFRLPESLSDLCVEAILVYPMETLHKSVVDSSCVYTSVHSSTFRVETTDHTFVRSPRLRLIPFGEHFRHSLPSLSNISPSITFFFSSSFQIGSPMITSCPPRI